MLCNKDIIVFSDDWGRHPFSCQHIMQHLLPGNKLLWVNTIGLRRPRLTLKDFERCVQKLTSFTAKPIQETLPDNLAIINPPMLPFANSWVRKFNRRSVITAVKRKMTELGMSAPIVIITVPNAADYIGSFNEVLSVYYCVDEFSEWPGVTKILVKEMETTLLTQVDFVAAVSDQLVLHKTTANGPTHLLTHGVDVAHFNHTLCCSNNCPPAPLARIKPPVVGYFGLIDERTDQDLIEALLVHHPDWSVVFIGKAVVDLTRLSGHQNFYHIDSVPYQSLPCYAASFSVCLLPYVRTKLTDNINPLKLKEYLATGKPIVSTGLPEAVKLTGWGVRIGNDYQEIIHQIESVLSLDSWESEKQISNLLQETWAHKAEQLSLWIDEILEGKNTYLHNRKCSLA